MKIFVFTFLCFFLCDSLHRVSARTPSYGNEGHANLPPRGWNSYDSFCWTISEEEFLHNADLVSKRLGAHGYQYVVVDYLWYRKNVEGASTDSLGFDLIDEWGRMVPDPVRWPSSKDGKGFTEVAKKVHDMGLKFGIHVMRGISTQAFNANPRILDTVKGGAYQESGREWHAQDIGIKERVCAWMQHGFMSIRTEMGAGRAFLRSLYKQYAEWGVDFVKHDCVFGDDLDINEITYVSEVLKELDRPILYSLSPGTSVTPAMAQQVSGLTNMYRITGDDWDNWGHVVAHFNVARDFSAASMTGSKGLLGKSWPDLDMLPLGWLTDPGSKEGPHRQCNLNIDEQRTQMTLWSMARSPLMFGGDVRKLDDMTFNLLTNPTILEINSYSSNNREFQYITGSKVFGTRNQIPTLELQRNQIDERTSDKHVLSLTSCKDSKASGWSIEVLDQDREQICWKANLERKYQDPFCLYKRKSLLASDEDKLHLLATDRTEFCLDASPKRKLTSKQLKMGSFSPCKSNANQMWELHTNGTLKSSYTGLCAIVKSNEAQVPPGGIRSWIATGRQGEIYLSFFNMNLEKMLISAQLSDLAKAIPGKSMTECKCIEAWSGKDFGVTKQSVTTQVESHGCALFVLNCV